MSLVDEILNKHKETWESTHIKDFTDAFLQEVEKVGNQQDLFECIVLCLVNTLVKEQSLLVPFIYKATHMLLYMKQSANVTSNVV